MNGEGGLAHGLTVKRHDGWGDPVVGNALSRVD